MPGLLRGVARTAIIAGTATSVSNNVSRRQARRWGQQEQTQAPEEQVQYAQPAPIVQDNTDPVVAQIEQLADLKNKGILTQEEFEAKKKQLLGI